MMARAPARWGSPLKARDPRHLRAKIEAYKGGAEMGVVGWLG
jgi:hypothetical protein